MSCPGPYTAALFAVSYRAKHILYSHSHILPPSLREKKASDKYHFVKKLLLVVFSYELLDFLNVLEYQPGLAEAKSKRVFITLCSSQDYYRSSVEFTYLYHFFSFRLLYMFPFALQFPFQQYKQSFSLGSPTASTMSSTV